MSDEQHEQPVEKQPRGWVVPTAVGVFIVGLVLTGLTAFIEHSFWLSSVCVNVGTTLLLAAPLAWLAHHLNEQIQSSRVEAKQQISKVRNEVDVVQTDLQQYQQETTKRIADLQSTYLEAANNVVSRDAAALDELSRNPDADTLVSALTLRAENGQLHDDSLIVNYYESRLYAKVQVSGPILTLTVFENGIFKEDFRQSTHRAESLTDLLIAVNKQLAKNNLIRIDSFNPPLFIDNVINGLRTIDECLENHYPNAIGAVVAVPNNHWLMTKRGMVAVKHPYPPIGYRQEAPEDRGWLDVLSEQPWYDKNATIEAFEFSSRMEGLARSWAHGDEITQRNQLRPPKDFRPRIN